MTCYQILHYQLVNWTLIAARGCTYDAEPQSSMMFVVVQSGTGAPRIDVRISL